MRYSLSNVTTGLANPRLMIEEVNGYLRNGLNHQTDSCFNQDGVDICSADWDNLIILDACRYDTFEKLGSELPGELKKRESRGSCTSEFLRHNFSNKKLLETIYITANPQLYRYENDVKNDEPMNVEFYKQYDLWKNNWAEEYRTVLPEIVTNKLQSVSEEYPNKRLIAHYLQPHAPYIGPTGKELKGMTEMSPLQFWAAFKRGELDVSVDLVKKAYQENVEIVLSHVDQLLDDLPGKTVVTSDHGEMFGERDSPIPIRQFGHPKHTYLPELIEIPWLVYQNGERKTIIEGDPQSESGEKEIATDTVKERLEDLGYA